MTRIRQWLLTAAIALALLLPLATVASADPGDSGGFQDPLIRTSGVTVHVAAPGNVTVTRTAASAAADPGDGGGFGP